MANLSPSETETFLEYFYRIEGSAEVLASYGEGAVPLLKELFEQEFGLRGRTIKALCLIANGPAREFILSNLNHPDNSVRAMIAIGLETWPDDLILDPLQQLLDDQHPSVRRLALQAAEGRGLLELKDKIRSALDVEEDIEVMRQAEITFSNLE